MSELRLCKEEFLQYRALEVQEKYYKKQLAELRDKYLIVDTVQDYRTEQARTVKIEDVQQTAYQREKSLIEAIILEIVQKRWVIKRTIDMAALDRDVEKSMQIVVALVIIGGERYEDVLQIDVFSVILYSNNLQAYSPGRFFRCRPAVADHHICCLYSIYILPEQDCLTCTGIAGQVDIYAAHHHVECPLLPNI